MATPPPSRDADLYDLMPSTPDTAPAAARPRPSNAEPVALPYRTPPNVTSGGFDERKIKDFQMPLWFLCGGVVIETIAAFIETGAFAPAMRQVGVNLILGTALMLVGIMPAARLRAIDLGQFWIVVLKLAAISVGPSSIVHLATPVLNFIPLGGLLGWLAEFVLYFALLGVFFDLDESDTWYCVCVIFLVRLAVFFVLLGIMLKWA